MSLILYKSPYNISRGGLDAGAKLEVVIGVPAFNWNNTASFQIIETYNLTFRNNYFTDVSSLIASEHQDIFTPLSDGSVYQTKRTNQNLVVQFTRSGFINGVAQPDETWTEVALGGYVYNTEPSGFDATTYLKDNASYAGSSDIVYKLDDSNLEIPLITTTDLTNPYDDLNFDTYTTVTSYLKGEIIATQYYYFNQGACFQMHSSNQPSSPSFKNRVETKEGGTLVETDCLKHFFDIHKAMDIDKLHISTSDGKVKTIEVKTLEAKKHPPYRLSFKNRFGVLEHLWFFGKSQKSMKVNYKDFHQNQLRQRIAGSAPAVDNIVRSIQQYDKNGVESLLLNSDWVDERMNPAFEQLMLSDEVLLYDFNNDVLQAVTVTTNELRYKTSVNDKLINYSINVEMSNNIIDDIV